MTSYMIRKPYSKKKGDAYIKIEIQKFEYNKKSKRSERKEKMLSLRVDLDFTSTLTNEDLYNQVYEFLRGKCYVE